MLKTTIAGSLPKPFWLAQPEMLWAPWQAPGERLAEAKRDATLLWIKEQEQAGLDRVRPLIADAQQMLSALPASAAAAAGAQGGNGAGGTETADEDEEVVDAEFTRE